MKCDQVKANFSSFYDGELAAKQQADIANHFLECEDCRSEWKCFDRLGRIVSACSCGESGLSRSAIDDRLSNVSAQPSSAPSDASVSALWNRIADRLEVDAVSESAVRAASVRRQSGRLWGRLWGGLAFALAASLLLVAVLRQRDVPNSNLSEGAVTASVDLSNLVELFAEQPSQAVDWLAQQFKGHELQPEKANVELGYQPAILTAHPLGTKVVASQVLTLPTCNCTDGVCTCGPGGCNCAASLCRRSDGSEFLVLEHCQSQKISFGGLRSQVASHAARKLNLVASGDQLAASWNSGTRGVTAIGLRDQAEAEQLASALVAKR